MTDKDEERYYRDKELLKEGAMRAAGVIFLVGVILSVVITLFAGEHEARTAGMWALVYAGVAFYTSVFS